MSLASNLFRNLRPVLTAALTATAGLSAAHGQTVETPFAIGLKHAKSAPYNFTGRIVLSDTGGFGSGTLLRRHTVQTAGHVVFDPTAGFTANATFTRALYQDYQLSQSQVIGVASLGGYQAAVISSGSNDTLTAFDLDMGYLLLHDPPVDENWANFVVEPSLLSSSPTFIVGYPGVTFDGVTQAYIVPPKPFFALGTSTTTALYGNFSCQVEEGMSGGPVYVVPDGVHQYVAAETVAIQELTFAGDANTITTSAVRAIDKTADKFLSDAEYTAQLISSVTLTGPKKVTRGQTYTYTTTINFAVPSTNGSAATTDRYSELKLKSNAANTKTTKFVNIVKTSNTTFNVTYTSNLRPGATVTLQVYYDKTATPVGKSSRIIKVVQ